MGKHKFFNTNNLWVDLEALKAAYAKFGGALPLPVMKNLQPTSHLASLLALH